MGNQRVPVSGKNCGFIVPVFAAPTLLIKNTTVCCPTGPPGLLFKNGACSKPPAPSFTPRELNCILYFADQTTSSLYIQLKTMMRLCSNTNRQYFAVQELQRCLNAHTVDEAFSPINWTDHGLFFSSNISIMFLTMIMQGFRLGWYSNRVFYTDRIHEVETVAPQLTYPFFWH